MIDNVFKYRGSDKGSRAMVRHVIEIGKRATLKNELD
jgi:hypothetical protein